MKVAVLGDDRPSYVRPLAEGLFRMLKACGADPILHYDGMAHLGLQRSLDRSSLRSFAGSTLRIIPGRRAFEEFLERVGDVDLIVVVLHVPASFAKGPFPNIEALRERLPGVPIVNYDMQFLPTLNSWARFLLRGEKTALAPGAARIFDKGSFGLDRYDWYLMVSVDRELRLPPGPLPYSRIGLDLDDGSLYPAQQGKFSVLVDFVREVPKWLAYRKVQLEALRLAGVDYVVLEGRYSMDEIRAIYRRTSMYFLAFTESFGLPVCELQACGSKVYMPDPYWASSHWISEKVYGPREPMYSSNFVVYENDPERLAECIREEARTFDPAKVRDTFERVQPELLHGDRAALLEFLERVDDGTIHSRLHKSHAGVGA
jgi:hypothetical protein